MRFTQQDLIKALQTFILLQPIKMQGTYQEQGITIPTSSMILEQLEVGMPGMELNGAILEPGQEVHYLFVNAVAEMEHVMQ